MGVDIIDDLDAEFSFVGDWWTHPSGYLNQLYYSFAGDGSDVATWAFTVTSGLYRVAATWAEYPNRATNAPFTIYDGAVSLETVQVNQQLAPDDFTDQGVGWEILGTYTITGAALNVELADNANGLLIADAIRIELHKPLVSLIHANVPPGQKRRGRHGH